MGLCKKLQQPLNFLEIVIPISNPLWMAVCEFSDTFDFLFSNMSTCHVFIFIIFDSLTKRIKA